MSRVCALTSESAVKVSAVRASMAPLATALVTLPSPSSTRPAQPVVDASPDLWGGYAVAWQRIDDAIRAGAKISAARYWLSLENVATVSSATTPHEGPLHEVACGVLFDSWTGVLVRASSRPVLVPSAVCERFWKGVDEHAGVAPESSRDWTLGRAALEVLAPSPSLQHNDWIGAAEVLAAQSASDRGSEGYAGGRLAQLSEVAASLFAQLAASAGQHDKETAAMAATWGYHDHRGVAFVDVTPTLVDGRAALRARAAALLVPFVRLLRADPARAGAPPRRLGVAGVSSRGYLFAPYVSMALEEALGESVAVFTVFKGGALPESAVIASGAYGKEYASAKDERLVVHKLLAARDAAEWDVLVVDDLCATGGSAVTAVELLRAAGPHIRVQGVVTVTDVQPLRAMAMDRIYGAHAAAFTLFPAPEE